MLTFFIIFAIIVGLLKTFLGVPMWVSLVIFCLIIWGVGEVSKQKTQERLEILKIKKKEKNEEFEPTKIIEINTTSTDISMDFLINEKKEKFAISYCDASNENSCKFIEYKFVDLKDYNLKGERKAKKEQEFIEVDIYLYDINCPMFRIEFFNCDNTDKEKYEECLKNAKELCSMLLSIKDYSHKKVIKNNTVQNETKIFSKLEQVKESVINTKVYSFIFNVIGIKGEQRLNVFDELSDDTELSIDIDGVDHKVLIETENGVFGSLAKKDVEICFQAIAEISDNDIHTIFAWTVNYDCQLVFVDKSQNKCKIKIEFWHEDFDRSSENINNDNIEFEKDSEKFYNNKKLTENTFN